MSTTTTWGRIAPATIHPRPARAFGVAGITTATVTTLALMHLAVAAVLIPALRRNAAGQGATS